MKGRLHVLSKKLTQIVHRYFIYRYIIISNSDTIRMYIAVYGIDSGEELLI